LSTTPPFRSASYAQKRKNDPIASLRAMRQRCIFATSFQYFPRLYIRALTISENSENSEIPCHSIKFSERVWIFCFRAPHIEHMRRCQVVNASHLHYYRRLKK